MIHWIIFNLVVAAVSLSLIFNIRNDITTTMGLILLIVAIILLIKDFFAMRG